MKTLQVFYRIERNWPAVSRGWSWVPEHENLTLKQAKEIHEKDKAFPDMQSRIVRTTYDVIASRKARKLTKQERQTRDFVLSG